MIEKVLLGDGHSYCQSDSYCQWTTAAQIEHPIVLASRLPFDIVLLLLASPAFSCIGVLSDRLHPSLVVDIAPFAC